MNSCLQFAGKILLKNVQDGFTKNLLVSPLSLNATTAMIGVGCSGRSLDRVLRFLGCNNLDELKSRFSDAMSSIATSPSCSDNNPKKIPFAKGVCVDKHSPLKPSYQQYVCRNESSPKITFANGVWVGKRFPLKPSYQQCVGDVFKSETKNVDFSNQADEVVKEINSWAEFQTNGLIKNVIQRQHIDSFTALVLGNALYFKGYWLDKFNPQWTKKRDFYLLNGEKISVPFMTSSTSSYLYRSFDDFKVLEIPYQRGREDKKQFCMQILLPNEKDGLQNLLEKYNADSSGILNKLNFNLDEVKFKDFWIPKFKFSARQDNIKFPFMEDEMELTEIVHFVESGGYPFISNIIQKAFIELDEQGTEAAAFTFTVVEGCAPGRKRRIESFVADHPYMFTIKEKISGYILLVGAVLNPLLD